jgi:hypothetical protein
MCRFIQGFSSGKRGAGPHKRGKDKHTESFVTISLYNITMYFINFYLLFYFCFFGMLFLQIGSRTPFGMFHQKKSPGFIPGMSPFSLRSYPLLHWIILP